MSTFEQIRPGRGGDPDRVIRLPGCRNVRDLGGLTTTAGRSVRTGRLFRSEYPGYAGAAGGEATRILGLVSVVDLRREVETRFELVPWEAHGVAWHHHPLSAGRASSWEANYHAYLEHAPEAVAAAITALIGPGARPALFHCAAGKDRTGVIAALLLCLLDVDREQIVADYVLTSIGLPKVMDRLSRAAPYVEVLSGWTIDRFAPRAETMIDLLDWLDTQGGALSWLAGHGVDKSAIDHFRAEMLGD